MLKSLAQVLPHAAQRFGRKTALIMDGREFNFQELDALSNTLARNLVKLGIEPGDRVNSLFAKLLGMDRQLFWSFKNRRSH